MWKKIRRVLMVILAVIFLFCGGTVAVVQHQYQINKRLYREASAEFTEPNPVSALHPGTPTAPDAPANPEETKKPSKLDDGVVRLNEVAPIRVSFDGLHKVNQEVTGWIYCPDTVINYPVLHTDNNDTYLHHSYNGVNNASGSIFVDARNRKNFVDPISIVYGHHMSSGSMFAILDRWQSGEFFQQHPVMWLLTPEQDYKVELFAAYHTSAYSDTYMLFERADENFLNYLYYVESQTMVRTNVKLDQNAHYVLLSTCAYIFDDARAVVIGKLTPVMSAGGVPME